MKANELRIGNIVKSLNVEFDYCLIDEISVGRVVGVRHHEAGVSTSSWDNCIGLEPIPLTDEWLLKFGFEKKVNSGYSDPKLMYWDYRDITLFIDYNGLIYLGYDNNEYYECVRFNDHAITYVHQLQNVYFALTGKELAFVP